MRRMVRRCARAGTRSSLLGEGAGRCAAHRATPVATHLWVALSPAVMMQRAHAMSRAERSRGRNGADVSPPVEAGNSSAHSEVQIGGTRKEASAMRSVALDLAVRKITPT